MYFVYLPDACSADSPLNPEKLCAIRYLAGILELPKLWRLKSEEGIVIRVWKRLFGFLSRLCETIFQLIQDMEPSGADDSEGDSSPLWTSARCAVDILAFATFGGFLQLHGLDEELPLCPSRLPSIVSFLIRYVLSGWKFFFFIFIRNPRPEVEMSFPKASSRAPQVKEILIWEQNAGTDSLYVPPDADSLDAQSLLTPRLGKSSLKVNYFQSLLKTPRKHGIPNRKIPHSCCWNPTLLDAH